VSSNWVLALFGQPHDVIMPAARFATVQAFGLPPLSFGYCITTALNAQGDMKAGMIISIVNSLLNVLLAWDFLRNGMGYIGVAFAFTVCKWTQLAMIVGYVVAFGKQGVTWRIPEGHKETLTFSTYSFACLPSALAMWAEWWALEILALVAGNLPDGKYDVAANRILANTLSIVYYTFVSAQIATSVRIGNLVGARDSDRLPVALRTAVLFSLVSSLLCAFGLYVFSDVSLSLYTSNERILTEAVTGIPGIVASVPPYAVVMCLMGAMRSLQLQSWAAPAVFLSFYVLGIPIGSYLALDDGWGLLGVWLGNALGLLFSAILLSFKMSFIDWPRTVEDAMAYSTNVRPDSTCLTRQALGKVVFLSLLL